MDFHSLIGRVFVTIGDRKAAAMTNQTFERGQGFFADGV